MAALVSLSSCFGTSNDQFLKDGSFGLSILKISGDNQVAFSNALTKSNLRVQVVATDGFSNINNIQVAFTEVTSVGVEILSPLVETDSQGYASTQVKMPIGNMGAPVQIRAEIVGASSSAVFNLSVADSQPGSKYALETLNGGVEVAGVPFNFIVKVMGDDGKIDNTVNEARILRWTFNTANSWSGKVSVVPAAVEVCNFIGGICLVPPSTLMDSVGTTRVWVGDGPSGLNDVFAQVVTVVPNAASEVTFADKAGGPATGAVVVATGNTINLTADSSPQTYYGAAVDTGGNWIADATTGSWSTSGEMKFDTTPMPIISPYLSLTSGPTTVFTPTKAGKGNLTLSGAGFAAISKQVVIEPGVPSQVQVNTEHGGVETAGVPFAIDVKATDSKGNLVIKSDGSSPLNGAYQVIYEMDATVMGQPTGSVIDTAPTVSTGCSGFAFGTWVSPQYPENPQIRCGDMTYPSSVFVNGVLQPSFVNSGLIMDATGVSPVITVLIQYQVAPPVYIKGSIPVTVNLGPPKHTQLYRVAGDSDSRICDIQWNTGYNRFETQRCKWSSTQTGTATNGQPTYDLVAGGATETYYLAVEDLGGNFLYHAVADSYDFNSSGVPGAWAPDWTVSTVMLAGTPASRFQINPIHAGTDMRVRAFVGTAMTELIGVLNPAPISSYTLALDDGQNIGSPSVLRTHVLRIRGSDPYGNPTAHTYNSSTAATFQVSYSGATASPGGTAPRIPSAPSYSLGYDGTKKEYTLSEPVLGWLLPNSNVPVTVSVTDITDPGNNITATPIVVTPIPGPGLALKLRDAANGSGADVTGSTLMLNTDSPKSLYVALYDSEQNVSAGAGTWNLNSLPSLATVVNNSTYLDLTGNVAGSSAVSVTYGGLSASTTVQVTPGALNDVDVETTNAGVEGAGDAFSVNVVLKDSKGNVKTDINGSVTTNISVQNSTATAYGQVYSGPSGTMSLNYVNGVLTPPLNYTFYNSADAPQIVVSVMGRSGSKTLLVNSKPFDHVRIKQAIAGNYYAGDNLLLNVAAVDLYGNSLTSGAGTSPLNFSISSGLGGQDVVSTTLSGATSVAGGSDQVVTGNLVSGTGQITVKATQTGNLQFAGTITGYSANPSPPSAAVDLVAVLPRPQIDSIVFDPAPTNPHTASATYSMDPFGVKLKDVHGNTITTDNVTQVSITTPGSTKSLQGSTTITVTNGSALFTGLKYAKAESFTLRATEATSSKTVQIGTFNVNPGLAVQAIVVLPGQTFNQGETSLAAALTGAPSAQAACSSFSLTVYAVDDGFNVVSTYNGSVGLTTSDAKATPPASGNFASGVKSFTFTPRVASTQTLSPVTGLGYNLSSTNYTVNVGSASQALLLLAGQTLDPGSTTLAAAIANTPTTQSAGGAFTVTAKLTDSCYNVVNDSSSSVALSAFGTGYTGTLSAPGSFPSSQVLWDNTKTFAAGSATFNLTYYKSGTGITLTPSVGGVTNNVSEALTVNNAVGDHLTLTAGPGATHLAGAVLGVQVEARDAYENKITAGSDASATITLTRAGGNNLISGNTTPGTSASIAKAISAGLANFTSGGGTTANVQDVSTGNVITASATLNGSAKTVQTGSFAITPAALNNFLVQGIGSPVTAGDGNQGALSITARDQYGNVKTDFTGAVTLTSTDSQAVLPGGPGNGTGTTTFAGGDLGAKSFASGAVVLKTAGTRSITATSGSSGSQTGITVNAAPVSRIAFTGSPSTATAGICSAVMSARSEDDYGNLAPVGSPVTVTIAGAAGSLSDAGADLYTGSTCATALAGSAGARIVTIPGGQSSQSFHYKGFKIANSVTLAPTNDGALSNVSHALTTNTTGLSLAYLTQPVASAVKGQDFLTQPVVRLLYAGSPVPGVVTTVTLAAYSNFTCTTALSGTLNSNTASPLGTGVASFSGLDFSHLTGGSQAVYFKATPDVGSMSACSSATTVYDALSLSPASVSLATGWAQVFSPNAGGGVPPLNYSVSVNNSQSATANCNGCSFLSYTAGQYGGGSVDTILVTDARGNTATASATVTGARLAWDDGSAYNYGTVGADTPHVFGVTNSGSATSGSLSATLSNCKRDATTITCSDMWDINAGFNCQGNTIAAAGACSVTGTFKASTGTGAVAGTYTGDLTITGSGGGSVKITLTATK